MTDVTGTCSHLHQIRRIVVCDQTVKAAASHGYTGDEDLQHKKLVTAIKQALQTSGAEMNSSTRNQGNSANDGTDQVISPYNTTLIGDYIATAFKGTDNKWLV